MSDTLTLGYTQDDAARRLKTFRRVFAVTLVIQVLLCLFVIFTPRFGGWLCGVNVPAWDPVMRIWAATLLLATVLQFPCWYQPIRRRFTVGIAIAGRFWMSGIFFSLGEPFLRMAVYDLIFGVALVTTFHRALIAELQSRP